MVRNVAVFQGMLILSLLFVACGCDRPSQPATPASQPAQATPTTVPQTVPSPTSGRPPTLISIDQVRYEFPPARILLRQRDDRVTAVLYSDDPREAIEDSYSGNSFYIETRLEIPDASAIDGAEWTFSTERQDRAESPSGIFLAGTRVQLQPADVQISFHGQPPTLQVRLSGTFLRFDALAPDAPPVPVPVAAVIPALVQVK
jgi:hypothetical protein